MLVGRTQDRQQVMAREFAGQVVLVTGAARGIGLAIARRFAEENARVFVADINESQGENVAGALRAEGFEVDFLAVDLKSSTAAREMVSRAVDAAGRLDVLVNNARAGSRRPLLEESEENWDVTMAVGVKAAFFATQEATRVMSRLGGGVVLNIASVAAIFATQESASYHVAKAGVMQMTKYLAVAAGPVGVRVNCILPGFVVQEDHRSRFESFENASYREMAESYQPSGRVGTERDVAETALFMCSSRAPYLSGACLVLDGAATAQDQFGLLLKLRGHLGAQGK